MLSQALQGFLSCEIVTNINLRSSNTKLCWTHEFPESRGTEIGLPATDRTAQVISGFNLRQFSNWDDISLPSLQLFLKESEEASMNDLRIFLFCLISLNPPLMTLLAQADEVKAAIQNTHNALRNKSSHEAFYERLPAAQKEQIKKLTEKIGPPRKP